MLMVDSVAITDEGVPVGRATASGGWACASNGAVPRAAMFELLAQCYAGVAALKKRAEAQPAPSLGFLVAVRRFEFLEACRAGDELEIVIEESMEIGDFSVVNGSIFRNGTRLGGGQIKVFLPAAQQDEAALNGTKA